jgi:hypothetical protein
MTVVSLILFMALCWPLPVNCFSGQHRNGAADKARSAVNPTGYHGPAVLGPLNINNNKLGAIDFSKLWSLLGQVPAAPPRTDVCYHDPTEGVYLVVERGADDWRLVRGLTLSRINVCPEQKIYHASGFSTWTTEKGIRLGSSATDVVSRYGEPSSVSDRRTDPEFYFSPYPLDPIPPGFPRDGRTLNYLPKEGAPDTSHAFFGVRNGLVVWMTVSDNE